MPFVRSVDSENRASFDAVSSTDAEAVFSAAPVLAVVLPTYNERANIPLIIARLRHALRGLAWEAIFVDDDSPDHTAAEVAEWARTDPRIRLIHRIGRRGLASACIDGMLATTAPCIAVMDADLQHDEAILPRMLARLHAESLDVIVGTRNAGGGSMGDFSQRRILLSRVGEKIGHAVCRCRITDPMSGFFIVRRTLLLEVLPYLQRGGFKILVDILASSRRPISIGEVGYTFRPRCNGESKLDVFVGIEYLSLVFNKLLGGILPARIGLFALVGGIGVVTHLLTLTFLTLPLHMHFVAAQACATFVAMAGNFYLNNIITFRDRRLRGQNLIDGAARFVLACSIAAWANVVLARALWQSGATWYFAGLVGILFGSAWNLSVSCRFTWGVQRHTIAQPQLNPTLYSGSEVPR